MNKLSSIITSFIITLILYARIALFLCSLKPGIIRFGIDCPQIQISIIFSKSVIIIFCEIQMPSIFQGMFKRNLIVYQPEQWSKRLGQKCTKCDKNLTHEKSISVCKCYYFCHQDCFKTSFQQQVHNENTDIRCEKCQENLQVRFDVHFKYGPLVTKQKIFKLLASFLFLILTVLAIIITLNSQVRVEYSFFILYLLGIIMSLSLYCLVVTIRDIFHRKVVKIQEVLSTKLDIQTSAFKDIEMQTNEQMTKQCLYTIKK